MLPLFAGCGTVGYYAQAIRGQCQILRRQEPIAKLLADTNTPPKLRQRLELVLRLRTFAEQELGLPADGHYLRYADLQRRFAVWTVYAAPEFSLDAKSWWYPVVGRLEYQGYFDEAKARRYAAHLAARGYDVHVGGVVAYSTLNWFRDPVLNTFLFADETALAEILFHELAHQRVFVPGDTEFNEAFATAVGEHGVERWLRSAGDAAALARHRLAAERREEFIRLITAGHARLDVLYDSKPEARCACEGEVCAAACPARELRRLKQEAFGEMRREYEALKLRWGGDASYDGWFRQPLNNALLNTVDTYYALVPGFRRMLEEAGGDLPRFYADASGLGRVSKTERHHRLQRAAAPPRRPAPLREAGAGADGRAPSR